MNSMKTVFELFFNNQNPHEVLNLFWACYFHENEKPRAYSLEHLHQTHMIDVINDWTYLPYNWMHYVKALQQKKICSYQMTINARRMTLEKVIGREKANEYNPTRSNLKPIIEIIDAITDDCFYMTEKDALEHASAKIMSFHTSSDWQTNSVFFINDINNFLK